MKIVQTEYLAKWEYVNATAYLFLSLSGALWVLAALQKLREEGVAAAAAAPPDTLHDACPDAVSLPPAALPAHPPSGSLGVEVKEQLPWVMPDIQHLPPLAWNQKQGAEEVQG